MYWLRVAVVSGFTSAAAAQSPAAVDSALLKIREDILRAAAERDVAPLVPLLWKYVEIGERHVARDQLDAVMQTWPEDFGPSFWRDLADAARAGIVQVNRDAAARASGSDAAIFFYRDSAGWRISRIATARGPRDKVMPVDVAASDPELALMREQIKRAVAVRDPDLLLPLLGPSVRMDFEAPVTPEQVVERFKTCAREDCDIFWQHLHDGISLGMGMHENDGSAWAPYVFVKSPGDHGFIAITGDRVALRAAPEGDATVVAWLSYDAVRETDERDSWSETHPLYIDGFRYGWRRIVTASGQTGWVSERFARSSMDIRLGFEKIDGQWKLVAIIAGD